MSISPDPAATSKQPRRALRVLVTGSREFEDRRVINDALDTLARRVRSLTVVHGDCPRGADRWTRQWLVANYSADIDHEPHPADWKQHGKQAGFIRNSEMVRLGADLCLAFIRNESNGATHCATEAEKAGIPTIVYRQIYPDLSQVADALALSADAESGASK